MVDRTSMDRQEKRRTKKYEARGAEKIGYAKGNRSVFMPSAL